MSALATISLDDETLVASFNTALEAEMARGRLEVDGIASRVLDGNTVGIAHHISNAIGGAKLMVSRSDLEAARAILFSPSALVDAPDGLEGPEQDPGELAKKPITANDNALAALRASILGLVVAPVIGQVWSSLLLVARVLPNAEELDDKGKRHAAIAGVIDASVFALVGYLLSL
jgi:hypothetical protein